MINEVYYVVKNVSWSVIPHHEIMWKPKACKIIAHAIVDAFKNFLSYKCYFKV